MRVTSRLCYGRQKSRRAPSVRVQTFVYVKAFNGICVQMLSLAVESESPNHHIPVVVGIALADYWALFGREGQEAEASLPAMRTVVVVLDRPSQRLGGYASLDMRVLVIIRTIHDPQRRGAEE